MFRRVLFSLLLALTPLAAQAASPIESLPAIGSSGSVFPLPDPALTVQHLWITQGSSGDFKITPTQMGYVVQKTTAPLNPIRYQLWLDTSTSPVLLKRWLGSQWVIERELDLTAQTSNDITGLAAAHLLVGNTSGVATDVAVSGDLTLATTGAFTIVNDAITTDKILDSAVTTAKIADGAVTTAKIAGRPVYGASGTSTAGNVALMSNNSGDGIQDAGGPISVLVGGTAAATLENFGVLIGHGTAAVTGLAPGTTGYPLLSAGGAADPVYDQLDLAGGGITGILPQANFTDTPTFVGVNAGATGLSVIGPTQLLSTLEVGDISTFAGDASFAGTMAVTGAAAFADAVSFGTTLSRDANFYLTLSSSNPIINFNPSTYLIYDRSLGRFALVIGSVSITFTDAGNVTISGCLNYNGGTLGVCL